MPNEDKPGHRLAYGSIEWPCHCVGLRLIMCVGSWAAFMYVYVCVCLCENILAFVGHMHLDCESESKCWIGPYTCMSVCKLNVWTCEFLLKCIFLCVSTCSLLSSPAEVLLSLQLLLSVAQTQEVALVDVQSHDLFKQLVQSLVWNAQWEQVNSLRHEESFLRCVCIFVTYHGYLCIYICFVFLFPFSSPCGFWLNRGCWQAEWVFSMLWGMLLFLYEDYKWRGRNYSTRISLFIIIFSNASFS